MTIISLALFITLLLAVGLLIRWTRTAQTLPWIESNRNYPLPDPAPKVSLIVPARNEEDNIEPCLTSLLMQDYPDLEIIVVNDQSHDRTPEILAQIKKAYEDSARDSPTGNRPRLDIIEGKPCPDGWMGKNHALYQGYQTARGDFLLFMDADTLAHPKLVRDSVGFALQSDTGLLTLIHSCEFQCFWDSVVNTLILYFSLFQKLERFNDPDDPAANSNGPFLLFRRDAYEQIGGHEAIKGEVVEDLVLARRVKEKRIRLTWALAPDLLISRPYPSLADLRKGWGKVIFRSIERNPRLLRVNLLSPLFLGLYLLLPWGVLATLAIKGFISGGNPVLFAQVSLALCQILTIVGSERLLEVLFRLRPVYPFAYPLGALVLGWIQLEAVFRFISGGKVTWKGRQYGEGG